MGLFDGLGDFLGLTDSKAPQRAADAQIAASNEATALQREMYNQQRQDMEPWRRSGNIALRDLMYGMGYEMPEASRGPAPRSSQPVTASMLSQNPEPLFVKPSVLGSRMEIGDAIKVMERKLGEGYSGQGDYSTYLLNKRHYQDQIDQYRKIQADHLAKYQDVAPGDQVKAAVMPPGYGVGDKLRKPEYGTQKGQFNRTFTEQDFINDPGRFSQVENPFRNHSGRFSQEDFENDPGRFSRADNPYRDHSGVFSLSDFKKDPGYEFRMKEGQKALERSAAARGGRTGGRILKELTRYGQNYASNEYDKAYNRFNQDYQNSYNRFNADYGNSYNRFNQDYQNAYSRHNADYTNAFNRFNANQDRKFNRLSSLAGLGQSATGQVANAGANFANQAGQNIIGQGNARAAAEMSRGNSLRDLMQMGAQVAGMYYGFGMGK